MSITRPTLHLAGDRPWLGVNFWSRQGGPMMWRSYDDALVRTELQTLADHGLRVTRSFLFWPDFQPAPDRIDPDCLSRLRQFLTAHEDLGMTTIPTFIVGHMSGQNFDVPWRDGRDLYRDGFMLGQQAFYIREVVAAIADSPAIAGWLLSNEIPHYGGATTPDYARAWARICIDAVRAGGSSAPVSLGDGAWGRDMSGVENGFRLGEPSDLVDFVGPHVYAMDDDQARMSIAAAVACELSHVGRPVVLEEFGVSSALCSDENAAHYYRQVLHLSLLAGATGWLGWNNTDFALPTQEPYRHHLFELGFGLTTAEGDPKPALGELRDFAELIERIDLAGCQRTDTATAVLVPAFLDADVPFVDDSDRRPIPRIVKHAYLAAKRADLAPALVREADGVPAAQLLLIPSAKALMGETFEGIIEAATRGSHVYLSYFAGDGTSQKGAWWPPLEPLFGVRHTLRYGLADLPDDEVVLTVGKPFGELAPGSSLRFRAAGSPWARSFLPVEGTEAEVLLTDSRGRPALVRRRVGAGALYLGAYPIEFYGSERRDANLDDEVSALYTALADEAGVTRAISAQNSNIVVDTLTHRDGTRYAWLVNITATTQDPQLRVLGAQELEVVGSASAAGDPLGPFAVRVTRVIG